MVCNAVLGRMVNQVGVEEAHDLEMEELLRQFNELRRQNQRPRQNRKRYEACEYDDDNPFLIQG